MLVRKRNVYILTTLGFIIILLNLNFLLLFLPEENEEKYIDQPFTSNSDSILFNKFTYDWYAIVNDNPSQFYTGQENYSYIGGNTFRCNEKFRYQYTPWQYDYRDVNNSTRHFLNSTYWGDNKHDWVWIFRNTTIGTSNIPIAIIEIGNPEEERFFNVTGEANINLNGFNYDVWVLEDGMGSIAYYEKNTGILINGSFIFEETQTWTIKMTNTNADIPTNEYSPVLSQPQVSPSVGNLTTIFTFAVNYSDADNNIPRSINVIINSSSYSMVKQNPFDVNYIDGVIYEFQTFLLNGTYYYFFNASDGLYNISTSILTGPTVNYNNLYIPILSESSVYPLLGYNTSTLFEYRVKYLDSDNNAPIYVNLKINNTIYSMQKEDYSDLNFMDGLFYTFKTYLNETGYYVFNYTASDGENIVHLPDVGYYHNPNVTLNNLKEVNIGWVTTHGETSNTTYSTFLSDAISLGATSIEYNNKIDPYSLYPFEMLIIEEGGKSWLNSELNILKNWVENGGRLVIIGDNRDDAQVSVSNLFNVSYSEFFATGSNSHQIFQPHYLTVNINTIAFGTQGASINLSISNPALEILINSTVGEPQVCLLELGFGKVLWIIDEIVEDSTILKKDNRIFGQNVLRWLGETKINNYIPSFSNPEFNPLGGNPLTFFNFSVTYKDEDNRGPIYINVTINQNSYQMIKQNPNSFNFKDGVVYQFITTLQNGTYQYCFNASDGVNEINSPLVLGPSVSYINNFDPKLTSGQVSPLIGFSHTTFVFKVNYSDNDNNEPKFVNVVIDNTPYLMKKKDKSDNYYYDGVIYVYEKKLNVGTHNYYFNASDAEKGVITSTFIGPIVYLSPLTNTEIGWIRTHGELSNSSYTKILNDARNMGANVTTFTSAITNVNLQNFNIIVVNEGGTTWTSEELNDIEEWVINGGSILILGDQQDESQVSLSSRFKIYYSSQLGSTGNSSQILAPNHEVTLGVSTIYFSYPECTISPNSNSYITPLINDRNGRLIIASLYYGSGKILWISDDCLINSEVYKADNNLLSNNSWIWLAKTFQNENPPYIINAGVNPNTGNSRINYNFYLNYTDPDGSAPIFVNLNINGTTYLMIKKDKGLFNFSEEIEYNFSIRLSSGTYYYHFNISDGKFNNSYPIGQLELIVSYINLESPSLFNTNVNPYLGFGEPTLFTFQTNYTDLDNTPPNYIRIYIDGVQYSMIKLNPSDLSYYDGVIYQFQMNLSLGKHNYSIIAYDGIYTVNSPITGVYSGPIVVEKNLLSLKKIGWIRSHGESGYSSFSIYISDAITLGASIEEITDPITIDLLSDFEILIIYEGGTSWNEQELNVLSQWVSSGRSLFIIGDERDDSLVNVSNNFGVYYKPYYGPSDYTSNFYQPHTLTNGLKRLYTMPFASIDEILSTSELIKLIRDIDGELIVATRNFGAGIITWICDEDILRDININRVDNRLFANNTWLWAIETTPGIIDGKQDDLLLILIISSSTVVGGVIIGVIIYTVKRRKSKHKDLIDQIVDDIQDKKIKE